MSRRPRDARPSQSSVPSIGGSAGLPNCALVARSFGFENRGPSRAPLFRKMKKPEANDPSYHSRLRRRPDEPRVAPAGHMSLLPKEILRRIVEEVDQDPDPRALVTAARESDLIERDLAAAATNAKLVFLPHPVLPIIWLGTVHERTAAERAVAPAASAPRFDPPPRDQPKLNLEFLEPSYADWASRGRDPDLRPQSQIDRGTEKSRFFFRVYAEVVKLVATPPIGPTSRSRERIASDALRGRLWFPRRILALTSDQLTENKDESVQTTIENFIANLEPHSMDVSPSDFLIHGQNIFYGTAFEPFWIRISNPIPPFGYFFKEALRNSHLDAKARNPGVSFNSYEEHVLSILTLKLSLEDHALWPILFFEMPSNTTRITGIPTKVPAICRTNFPADPFIYFFDFVWALVDMKLNPMDVERLDWKESDLSFRDC
jgi:hypothetical protein